MRGIAILQDGSIATMEPVYTKHGNVMEKLIALTDLMNGIAQSKYRSKSRVEPRNR